MLQKLINKLNDLRPRQLAMLAVGAAVLMFITVYFGMSLLTKQEVIVQPEEPPPSPVASPSVSAESPKISVPNRIVLLVSIMVSPFFKISVLQNTPGKIKSSVLKD